MEDGQTAPLVRFALDFHHITTLTFHLQNTLTRALAALAPLQPPCNNNNFLNPEQIISPGYIAEPTATPVTHLF